MRHPPLKTAGGAAGIFRMVPLAASIAKPHGTSNDALLPNEFLNRRINATFEFATTGELPSRPRTGSSLTRSTEAATQFHVTEHWLCPPGRRNRLRPGEGEVYGKQ